MELTRRGFLGSILALAIAPAIVRAQSLMPVRGAIILPEPPALLVPVKGELVKVDRFIIRQSYNKLASGGLLRTDYWSDKTKDFQFCDDDRRAVVSADVNGYRFEPVGRSSAPMVKAVDLPPDDPHSWRDAPDA